MKTKKRTYLLIALIVLAIAGGTVATILIVRARSVPIEVSIMHPFAKPDEEKVMASALSDFQSIFPHIKVVDEPVDPDSLRGTRLAGLDHPADLVTDIGPGAPVAFWSGPPVLWTGNLWVLAARRGVEAKLKDQAASFEALREGTLSTSDFESLLAEAKSAGLDPITLGNSHGWPFLLWLQHWTAATIGPDAVIGLPKADAQKDDPWLVRVEPAYRELASWKAKGWFSQAVWKEAWPRGLAPLREGKALFALVSPPLFSALDPATRQDLEFFPFPGSKGGVGQSSPWTIGSVWSIGIRAGCAHPDEAAKLLEYLTSPGITAKLSKQLDRPFFAWKTKPGDESAVIPDWYGAANTAELERLIVEYGRP
jgi:ABC-type glycerol-3-phosphate transport system substrate-binding protein